MSIFICEKCGRLSNTALRGSYWHASHNIYRMSEGKSIDVSYKPEFEFFETHRCCDKCTDGVVYKDNSGVLHPDSFTIPEEKMTHWSSIGKEKLLEMEARGDGSMVNAKYFFEKGLDKITMPASK